ncbi:cysteine and histidine-rich domain-containing protein 1 [Gadus chalcogrammus]|uniref:cysteine and histidine-rich domain-containing protein 1 n=1 Tax=Gadus chalcogrammus TaxID=1042646 RepID=UPI0024C4A438|nr:cysteine and histidine-rich domain-containing protein 1 [Gadus chalcogrammus]
MDLCYNKGCGERFDRSTNKEDACLFHPGVPIFHDALKGWSCCRKRTTDFSDFLSIKGCTRGRHNDEKPEEPLRPDVSSEKGGAKRTNGEEIIYRGPKSAEALQRERPSSEEPLIKLPQKVSASLAKVLAKMDLSNRAEQAMKESQVVMPGTRCKNIGCKGTYQGPETDSEICTHHPGAPIFHEGYKSWSCCCIQTFDFNAFLDQKGCSTGKHCWIAKQDKKKVACRQDWHQTADTVFVTVYAKNANPEFSFVEANRTVISCDIQFENNKVYKREFHLWGVVDVKHSKVSMVPSKVEISLRKANTVTWGKLEDPNFKAPPEPINTESFGVTAEEEWDIEDDDISDSDDEWKYDKPPKKSPWGEEGEEEVKKEGEEGEKKKEEGKEEEKTKEGEKKKEGEKEGEKKKVPEEEGEKKMVEKEEEEEEDRFYDDLPPLDD